jgi:hypothetical protein
MRESSRVARDGSPSIAILTRDPNVRRHALASGDPRAIVDLSRGLRPLSYLRLIWRPTGRAVTGSRTGSLLLRLAGIAELEGVGERIRARDARAARKKRR